MDIQEIIKREWEKQGMCQSCGYHGLLYEYGDISDIEINEEMNRIELPCLSGESGHRGVRIYITLDERG